MNLARKILPALLVFQVACIPGAADILRVELKAPINPVTADFIRRSVEEAATREASLLLIRLDTPGGLGVSMEDIVQTVLNSRVPVAVYVAPSGAHAASAGFFILLAADVAGMAPGTRTGAAHPVFPFGGGDPTLLEKATNDALAGLRSIAEKKGRNRTLAEQAVRESRSFTEREALEGHLIDLVSDSESELLRALDANPAIGGARLRRPLAAQPVVDLPMTFRERMLAAISNPNLAVVLGILGLLGVYLEFTHPGLMLPGFAGTIALLLALLGFSILPINYVAVALIVLAIGLLVAEVKVQGFGVLGIGGTLALMLGILFLVDSPYPELRVGLSTALAVTLPFALIFVLLLRLVMRARARSPQTGMEALVGATGIARTVLDGSGKVAIGGELWEARARGRIEEGEAVRVVAVSGLTLDVVKADHVGGLGEKP